MLKNEMITYAFIDSQNLNLGIQDLGWKLDFGRFKTYLKDKYHVKVAYLFIGYVPGNELLYKYLQEMGYVCVFKPTLELPNGTTKGNVDAELVLHSMLELLNFDKAILVTGDGDFFCLAQYLKKRRKLGKIIVPDKNKYSGLLKIIGSQDNNIIASLNMSRDKLGRV